MIGPSKCRAIRKATERRYAPCVLCWLVLGPACTLLNTASPAPRKKLASDGGQHATIDAGPRSVNDAGHHADAAALPRPDAGSPSDGGTLRDAGDMDATMGPRDATPSDGAPNESAAEGDGTGPDTGPTADTGSTTPPGDSGPCGSPGAGSCSCDAGFAYDDAGDCVDIDECKSAARLCSPLAACTNEPGGFLCSCPRYYTDSLGNGSRCDDLHYRSAVAYGGAGFNLGYGAAVDSQDNVYVTGGFDHTLMFGKDSYSSLGSFDAYVVKLDTDLQPIWSKSFATTADDRITRVTTDLHRNVIMLGDTIGTMDFGGGAIGTDASEAGFVVKLDETGKYLWSKLLPVGPTYLDREGWPCAVATDADDNVYVGGRFAGAFDFGKGNVTVQGQVDMFIVKYSPDGMPLWTHTLMQGAIVETLGLAVDRQNDVIVTGLVGGSASFTQGPTDGYGDADAFLMKLDSGGNEIWSIRFGGSLADFGAGVAVGDRDEIVAMGGFNGTLTWGSDTRTGGSGQSVYVARVSATGDLLWLRSIDGQGAVDGYSIALSNDFVSIAGKFQEPIQVGTDTLVSSGLYDAYVARFAGDGTPLWGHAFGGNSYDEAKGHAANSSGNLFVTGWISGPAQLGDHRVVTIGQIGALLLEVAP